MKNIYCKIGFSIFGIKFGLITDLEITIERLLKLLPSNSVLTDYEKAEHFFSLWMKKKIGECGLFWNDELIAGATNITEDDIERLEHKIQDVLSLILFPRKFFLHAGAVAYKDVGIIFPGRSRAGKSTLTKEFLKVGAFYYSDDCAVIDKQGFLYPYPTDIKIRDVEQNQKHYKIECFGGKIGQIKVPLKIILNVQFAEDTVWIPNNMKQGEAVMYLMQNLFYIPSIHQSPAETIKFLTRLTSNSLVFEGERGEAQEVVKKIIGMIDSGLEINS